MLNSMKYLGIWTILVAFSLIAAQCGAQTASQPIDKTTTEEHEQGEAHAETTVKLEPVSLGAGEKLKVVATTSIVADLVKKVGGDLIDVTFLLPLGSDPHSFQPTPADVAKVADAHVVFTNGYGLEEFMTELLQNIGRNVSAVSCSEGIEPRQMGDEEPEEHEEGHNHEGVDPHTWMTPVNAVIFVNNIEAALVALDPAHAETYRANGAAYRAELEQLDTWVKAQIETIPAENRKLVTDHVSYGYYADRYGLEQIGAVVPSFSTAAESSAQELAELEDTIKRHGVKAVFVDSTINPGLEKRLAEDTGIKLVVIYSGSLGPAGSGAETYLDYIRYNTAAIVEALK